MQFIKRHNILQYPEYWFQIDEYRSEDGQQVLLAHLRFDQFNKTILKRVWKEWKAFRSVISAPLLAYTDDTDADKYHAFVSMLGFKDTGQQIVCNNGERRRLYISIKELPNERPKPTDTTEQPKLPDRPLGSGAEPAGQHWPAGSPDGAPAVAGG